MLSSENKIALPFSDLACESMDGGTTTYTSGTFTYVFDYTSDYGGEIHTVELEVRDDEGVWASKFFNITILDAERRFYNLTDHPSTRPICWACSGQVWATSAPQSQGKGRWFLRMRIFPLVNALKG